MFHASLVLLFLVIATTDAVAQGTARKSGMPALDVPDGFHVEIAAGPDLSAYPMFLEFDETGRLFIAESSGKDIKGKDMPTYPECCILLLEDRNRDGRFDTSKVFADKLSLPMGVLWYRGSLYVASAPYFLRFKDTNGDGVADEREVIHSGWNVLNTASLHGPFLGPDGYLYLTHGRHGYKIETREGELLEGLAARIWRCRPDGTALERVLGGGFDNPVELIWTDGGDMIGTMTYFQDPRNGQRDALMHWVEGGVYPKPHECIGEFIRTGDLMPTMTKFARIAPSGLTRYRGTAFGPEYAGNLFSAHFNPHRVQRHVLYREGATYRTEDFDFLTSTDPDFHPTDVIEDADGSLLVSDTGGWYVDACPLSRVAKPDIRGGIYRVRKTEATAPSDPWGLELALEKKRPRALAEVLSDPRFRVQDRAFELIVQAGEASVRPLGSLLKRGESSTVRAKAVWALGQIGTRRALETVRVAAEDPDPDVRTAVAHMAGLAKDETLHPVIARLLLDADPGVQREAATAAGRVCPPKLKADALLEACIRAGDRYDRFLEHAVIYALIQIRDEAGIAGALAARSTPPNARKAALIALDQMKSDRLRQEDVLAALEDRDEGVRKAALWVASHHPEWAEGVLEFVEARLQSPELNESGMDSLREILLAYAGDSNAHRCVAKLLGRQDIEPARKAFLLDVVEQAPIPELPASWLDAIAHVLTSEHEELVWRAVSLVRARGIGGMDETLRTLAKNASLFPSLRVNALAAIVRRQPELDATAFYFLLDQLGAATAPELRLSAAKTLGHAKLNPGQLQRLAQGVFSESDALTFAALLDSFRGQSNEAVGMALVRNLIDSGVDVNTIPGGLDELLQNYPPSVQTAAAPLRAKAQAEARARLEKLATLGPLLRTGDVGRGRQLFFSEKLACGACHAVGSEGGQLGPDLTTIGVIRSPYDLLEAVVFPNASFVPGYEPYRIEALDELGAIQIYEGVIGHETADAITLRTAAREEVRVPRASIRSISQGKVSIMPEGLDAGMTQGELLDLMAFLQSLNNEQWLQPERREMARK